MTRWLRFIVTFVSALFHSKADPTKEISVRFWTWFTDADVSIVNNGVVLTYLELGRLDFLVRSKLIFLLSKRGIYSPAAIAYVKFAKPLRRFQKLELRTKLIYWDPKWVWVEQKLYFNRENEKALATHAIIKATFRKGKDSIPFKELLADLDINLKDMEKPEMVTTLEKVEPHFATS